MELLLPGTERPYPEQYLDKVCARFARAGFELLRGEEAFSSIRFYDVGALVWFAKIIEWEFPDFSVGRCLGRLYDAQRILDAKGVLEAATHRFLLVAQKPPAEKAVLPHRTI